MYSFSFHQFCVEKWDFKAILTSNLSDVTKNAICVNPWNINWTWTMYEQYYALCFFFSNLIWVYFQFGPPCSALLIRLVAMRRKFYNIIQCKNILDPPFHYNNECTFKWFLEHDNELVCLQTLMPIFPGKIFPKTW